MRLLGGSGRGLLVLVEVNHFAHERGFGGEFAAHRCFSLQFAECAAPRKNVYFDAQLVAGDDWAAEAGCSMATK